MGSTDIHAVIMAGGSGTRFWPLSRVRRPKQLLPLATQDASLLQSTATRLQNWLDPNRIWVVTSRELRDAVLEQLPQVSPDRILAEPVGRNTAPCIAWAVARIAATAPEAIVAVVPADQFIAGTAAYTTALDRAVAAASAGYISTIGITPSRPETGYGYIELGDELGPATYRARRFVEKPDHVRAQHYLTSGNFLWNSGMFVFQARVMQQALQRHLPELNPLIEACSRTTAATDEHRTVERIYPGLTPISIDHGVMEKVDNVAVVIGEFAWSDVGSWTAAWELKEKDSCNNALAANVIVEDSHGCYVHAPPGKVVALLGVHDLVVVDTEDALLVMPRDRAQDLRTVVARVPHKQK